MRQQRASAPQRAVRELETGLNLETRWGQGLVLGTGFPPKSMLGALGAEFCRLGRLRGLPDFGLFSSSLDLSVSLTDSSGSIRILAFMDTELGF